MTSKYFIFNVYIGYYSNLQTCDSIYIYNWLEYISRPNFTDISINLILYKFRYRPRTCTYKDILLNSIFFSSRTSHAQSPIAKKYTSSFFIESTPGKYFSRASCTVGFSGVLCHKKKARIPRLHVTSLPPSWTTLTKLIHC